MNLIKTSTRRVRLRHIVPALVVALFALALPAFASATFGKGVPADVMTRNLYLGADLTPAIGAPSLEGLAAANGQILREVTANNFPTRAKGLAKEIRSERPDLVGLQEVALWRTAPPSVLPLVTGPSATTVRYDYLAELLKEVNKAFSAPTTKSSSSSRSSTSRRPPTRTASPVMVPPRRGSRTRRSTGG